MTYKAVNVLPGPPCMARCVHGEEPALVGQAASLFERLWSAAAPIDDAQLERAAQSECVESLLFNRCFFSRHYFRRCELNNSIVDFVGFQTWCS